MSYIAFIIFLLVKMYFINFIVLFWFNISNYFKF